MNQTIAVENKDIIKTSTVTNVELRVNSINLFDSVTVSAFLKDVDNNLIDIKYFTLQGQEYNNWGSDDDYIVNFILTKLDLVKKPE